MTHNKIKALTDFTPARVALQNQLGSLQQKRGLGRMFLGSQLIQPPIEVYRDAEIHSHALWYQYGTLTNTGCPRAKAITCQFQCLEKLLFFKTLGIRTKKCVCFHASP